MVLRLPQPLEPPLTLFGAGLDPDIVLNLSQIHCTWYRGCQGGIAAHAYPFRCADVYLHHPPSVVSPEPISPSANAAGAWRRCSAARLLMTLTLTLTCGTGAGDGHPEPDGRGLPCRHSPRRQVSHNPGDVHVPLLALASPGYGAPLPLTGSQVSSLSTSSPGPNGRPDCPSDTGHMTGPW